MIVFYHVPKTAGISVLHAVVRATDGVAKRVYLPDREEWLRQVQCGTLPDQSGIDFLSGHFGYGVHQSIPGTHQTLTFLRDPIEQALSMREEALKRPDIYPSGDFLQLLTTETGQPYFGNPQVRHLAAKHGRPIVGEIGRAHLERAFRVVTEELTCFGLTEYFASALDLIADRLGLTLSRLHLNESRRARTSELDANTLTTIRHANELDVELYERCRAVLFRRLSSVAPRARADAVPRPDDIASAPAAPADAVAPTVWLTGLSSAGKTSVAQVARDLLRARGYRVAVLDADDARPILSGDLQSTTDEGLRDMERIAWVASLLAQTGNVVLVAAVSPQRTVRSEMRSRLAPFLEVYIHAPIAVCETRDTLGVYRRFRSGEVRHVAGLDEPYEPPLVPDLVCCTDRESLQESAAKIARLVERSWPPPQADVR